MRWKQYQPRNAWARAFEIIKLEWFQEDVYFSFSNSIMRRSINTRCPMKDAILKHEGLKLFGHIFFGIITSQILNRNMKLSVNFSTKGTEVRK